MNIVARHLTLTGELLASPWRDGRRVGGTLLLIFALPVFILWQFVHWLLCGIDELLFRRYRDVEIHSPVFVIGPPRTGTTHLHHVLSADENTTTFRAWECIFGLSVSGRKLCLGLARLDRWFGRPVARICRWTGRRLFRSMHDIHPLGLNDPEEDFLCLLPIAACFLLVVPFPRADWVWKTARCDTQLNDAERKTLLRYYRRCIQKHLYVFGGDKRFLSKNASFPGWMQSLLDEFPDARILATTRDPLASVPSQLSSIQPALRACGFPTISDATRGKFIDLMIYYYDHIADVADKNSGRVAMLYNDRLRDSLYETVIDAFDAVGLEASPQFRNRLADLAPVAGSHVSTHKYSLESFGLSDELIRSKFRSVYARYQFNVRSQARKP